jgi:hypothetical protein
MVVRRRAWEECQEEAKVADVEGAVLKAAAAQEHVAAKRCTEGGNG